MRLSLLNKQKTKLNKNVAIDWHLRRFVKQKMNVLQQVIDIQVLQQQLTRLYSQLKVCYMKYLML